MGFYVLETMTNESEPSINDGLTARQKSILEYAREHAEVQVDPLAETFQVTPQTIRRDLNTLCDMRLIQRVHGGAVMQDGVANMGYESRRRLMVDEKKKIAAAVARLIPDDSSMFVNIGTTTEAVVQCLSDKRGLLVITNNLNVVNLLRHAETTRVMMAGGAVRREDGGIVGDSTAEFISGFKVDYAVVGISAIEEDGAFLEFDPREVRVSQAMIANARKVIFVADSLKFERVAPVRVCTVAEIDYLVTDKILTKKFLQHCRQGGVKTVVVD